MKKHHVIISGTGRAGTTVLVQLLTALGIDTGFKDLTSGLFANCDAGMEWDIRQLKTPYIIKSPDLCDFLDDFLKGGKIEIDHAFIPVRDLFSAAESRRDVTRRTDTALYRKGAPGGLWRTEKPEQQEIALANQLYNLIYTIAKWDVPVTFLYFPRFIHDPKYLYGKMEVVLKGITYEQFLEVFRQIVQPELVHDFRK